MIWHKEKLFMAHQTITISRDRVRLLTKQALKLTVIEYRDNNPGKGSFVLTDILHSRWEPPFMPFYEVYEENGKVAGQEMGKLLGVVAAELKLKSLKESKFGKEKAITRYFF